MTRKSPALPDDGIPFTSVIVRDLLIISVVWDIVRLLVAWVVPRDLINRPAKAIVILLLVKVLLVEGIPFFFWWRNRVRQAAWLMAFSATAVAGAYLIMSGGIRSSAVLALVSTVIVTGIVLGGRGAWSVGLPILGLYAALTAFQAGGGRILGEQEATWVVYMNALSAATIALVPIVRALGRSARMGEELRTSHLKLDTLMKSVDGIVWECNPRTMQFTFVSQKAERLLGYPVRQWLEEPNFWIDHMHPEDREWAPAHSKAANARGEDHEFEYRMLAADGRVVCLRNLVTVTGKNGQAAPLHGLMLDITARKEAEARLRESQARLEFAETGGGVGIWEIDVRTGKGSISGEWARLHGFPKDTGEATREELLARVHPEDRSLVLHARDRALTGSKPLDIEFRVVWPDGGVHWLLSRGHLVRDASGAATHLREISIDITLRREAEERLRESQQHLELAQSGAGIGIWERDLRTGEGTISGAWARLHGFPEHIRSVTGAEFLARVHPEDRERVRNEMGRAVLDLEPIDSEFRVIWPDGSVHWLLARGRPVYDAAGVPTRLRGINMDITRLKHAEAVLADTSTFLQTVIDTAPNMIFVVDDQGKYVMVNRYTAQYYGTTQERLISKTTGQVHSSEGETSAFDRDDLEVIRKRRRITRVERNTAPDGKVHWFQTIKIPLIRPDNSVNALAIATDITEQKELEEELRLANSQLVQAKGIAQLGYFTWDLVSRKAEYSAGIAGVFGSTLPVSLDAWWPRIQAGQAIEERITDSESEIVQFAFENLLAQGQEVDLSYRLNRPDGRLRCIHVRAARELDQDRKPIRVFGVAQDITEFWEAQERLRQLSVYLDKIREEERTRIAREIHDELGQQLTGLKMRAAWIATLTEPPAHQVRTELASMGKDLESAIRTVRRIATELRPPVLDSLGLIPALEWLKIWFERDHAIECVLDLESVEVRAEAATTIFRVAQEALTNAAKHAGATRVRMHLEKCRDCLILEVEDNGVGMQAAGDPRPDSFGVVGMRERAALLGGRLDLLTPERGGLLLRLTLPSDTTRGKAWDRS